MQPRKTGKSIDKAAVCRIFGAGEVKNVRFVSGENDLLIAADGGFDTLNRMGLAPHVLIGDFDSLKSELPQDIPVVRLPVCKDNTDMAAAVDYGEREGYVLFHFYGAVGGRSDHTYANYQLIADMSRRGLRGVMYDGNRRVSAISNETFHFPKNAQGTVSVFAHGGDAMGVTLAGLQYPLQDETLSPYIPLGVSNFIVGQGPTVSVRQGTLLLMWEEEENTLEARLQT